MRDEKLKRSRKQEERVAKEHGGRRQPGSGSRWYKKGDVRTKTTLIECKRTDAKQITLRADVLEKIWVEAWTDSLIPALVFELGGREWICHPRNDFIEHYGDDGAGSVARREA